MAEDFILYSTLGCHLCEDAKAICEPLLAAQLREQDIADSAELVERYGVRIPVLRHLGSDAELGWPFDEYQLRRWLQDL